jgi:DNA sulfur modification protein DndD
MILEQLTVRNFCLFAGEQVFDLTPSRRGGRHLPIILFGGMNGGGKTTLLDAIQLTLYGVRARCSKRANLSYEDFLRQSIHHGASGDKAAGVGLAFRYVVDGEEHLYDVRRTWKVADGRLREELRVFQDGLPDPWLSENWPQLVEELFPLDISQLFFFDAEKIRALADEESSSKALGAAIKSLLGLDIVERLITDSTVLQTRLAKRLGTPEHQSQVEALEQQARDHQGRFETLNTERASLANTLLRVAAEQKQAEEAFAAKGGRLWDARQDRARSLDKVKDREEALCGQLVGLAAGELPLALVPDLLQAVEEQDRRERQAQGSELIHRLLTDRDRRLLGVLRDAGGGRRPSAEGDAIPGGGPARPTTASTGRPAAGTARSRAYAAAAFARAKTRGAGGRGAPVARRALLRCRGARRPGPLAGSRAGGRGHSWTFRALQGGDAGPDAP